MATYTLDQYNSLVSAIAEGTVKVKYQDKEVTYRSLDEMRSILRDMEAALGLNAAQLARRVTTITSKGF